MLQLPERNFGERFADTVTGALGSWRFLIAQSIVIVIWVAINGLAFLLQWDPYPFILLNLGLSCQAAYAAPIIMMSQNRLAKLDRRIQWTDFEQSRKFEGMVEEMLRRMRTQEFTLTKASNRLELLLRQVEVSLREEDELPDEE